MRRALRAGGLRSAWRCPAAVFRQTCPVVAAAGFCSDTGARGATVGVRAGAEGADTVFALSSAPGVAAVSVVRISGRRAGDAARSMLWLPRS